MTPNPASFQASPCFSLVVAGPRAQQGEGMGWDVGTPLSRAPSHCGGAWMGPGRLGRLGGDPAHFPVTAKPQSPPAVHRALCVWLAGTEKVQAEPALTPEARAQPPRARRGEDQPSTPLGAAIQWGAGAGGEKLKSPPTPLLDARCPCPLTPASFTLHPRSFPGTPRPPHTAEGL